MREAVGSLAQQRMCFATLGERSDEIRRGASHERGLGCWCHSGKVWGRMDGIVGWRAGWDEVTERSGDAGTGRWMDGLIG